MINAGYQWRYGSPFKADANAFAAQLDELKAPDGTIELETVLEASRPEAAPLHEEIEWDDSEAAHKYRIGKVREIMGALRVIPIDIVREEPMTPVRAAIPVSMSGQNGGQNTYVMTVQQTTADQYNDTVRAQAVSDIKRLANRLRALPGCEDLAEKLIDIAELM
jgi:hypothetical protein